MKRKFIKSILYIVGIIAMILLFSAVMLWMKSPGITEPIKDPEGNPVEGSLSVMEKIILGGQGQYIIIRGVDAAKPIMLFLHGGPGSPEVAFIKHYNPDIERIL